MVSIALAFLIGVLTLLQFRTLPDVQLAWFIVFTIVLIFFSQHFWIKIIASCLCGFLWCLFVSHQVMGQGISTVLEGQDVLIEGRVEDFPVKKKLATRFLFSVDSISYKGKAYASPGKIRLSWYYATTTPKVGERWQFLVRLKQPHGFMNPGGFDYEAWLFQHRIRATGYVRKQHTPVRLVEADGFVFWQRLRFTVHNKIKQLSPDSPMTGLLSALAIGERNGIEASQWDVLRRTGTAHLMAISGLHIGLLASLGFWLGNYLWRLQGSWLKHFPAQKFAACIAIVFAFTYAALAGFSIPTQRALIMVCVVMLAMLRQRFIQPANVLAQSLILVLLLDPLSALSAGFWLSFAAVAVILYGLSGRIGQQHKWISMIRMQWVIVLGLLPLTIALFQQASLISPITNVLAIPVVGLLIVPLTLLASVALFIYEPLASGLLHLATWIMEFLWQGLSYASLLQYSQIQISSSPFAVVLAIAGIVLFIAPKGIPLRSLGMVFCLPLFFPVLERPDKGEMWLSLLDVGQGLAVVVQTRNHVLVYDTGPRFSDSFDTGEAVVAPFLRHQGLAKIDKLMVTHSDNDHIGGAAALIRLFPVSQIISSVPKSVAANAIKCLQGQQWQWDGVRFSVLHPAANYVPGRRPENNLSCVLRIESDNGSVLLTGDIENEAEQQLITQALDQGQSLSADVLVVPHHGSQTSSSQRFIEAVDPKLALYPVGYRNRYRLPSQKVLQRYASMSVPGHSTADSGRILLTFEVPRIPRVERHRPGVARFWHHRLP